nr:succinate dehydrogenase cytochrome b subunit [Deltaproteobacteria bacterium]
MDRALTLRSTTVGTKAIMAVTGAVLFGFVVVHMLGNLQLWLGAQAMHDYAVSLRKIHGVLWIARAVLLASVLGHAWSAFTLVRRNAAARPVPYKHARRDQATNYAARTMPITGVLVALYIVYHIMHLTLGVGVAAHDPQNPFNNVVHGFSNPLIAGVYIVANVLLGTHLFHGGYAWFNSLGLSNPRYAGMKRAFAMGLAGLITLGNVALPVSVLAGAVRPTTETFCSPELGPCAKPQVEPGR